MATRMPGLGGGSDVPEGVAGLASHSPGACRRDGQLRHDQTIPLPSLGPPATGYTARFPVVQFGACSLAVDRKARSLFFPDIELSRYLGNACAAALFDISGGRIAVFFEKDPDIGQITGRPVRI